MRALRRSGGKENLKIGSRERYVLLMPRFGGLRYSAIPRGHFRDGITPPVDAARIASPCDIPCGFFPIWGAMPLVIN